MIACLNLVDFSLIQFSAILKIIIIDKTEETRQLDVQTIHILRKEKKKRIRNMS